MIIIFSIFNFLTKILLIFPIFFIWINFYFKNLFLSFIISIIFTILLIVFFNIINKNKKEKKQLKFKQIDFCNKLSLNLLMSNNKTILDFFKNLYQNSIVDYQLNYIKYEINENEITEYIFPVFNKQCISIDEVLLIIKLIDCIIKNSENNLKKVNFKIICNNYDKDIISFLNQINLNIQIQIVSDIYLKNDLENYNFTFNNFIKEKNKTKISKLLFSSLNKKNSKRFAYAGFTLMIFSFFTFYNIYYSIASSILFLLAVYSFSNKKYN